MGRVEEVDRCRCHGKTFSALKQVANHLEINSLKELEAEVEFGQQCDLCRPYVRKMLKTGDVSFTSLITDK